MDNFDGKYWQIDGVAPVDGHHHMQSRTVGDWIIFSDIAPNDTRTIALNLKTAETAVAPLFTGKNVYTTDGASIILVASWLNPNNFDTKRRDLLCVIFSSALKQFLDLTPCLVTPSVFQKIGWVKVGSNN